MASHARWSTSTTRAGRRDDLNCSRESRFHGYPHIVKVLAALVSSSLASRKHRSNLRVLVNLLVVLAVIVAVYSVLFHILMLREGQQHSWLTGLYWTVVAMSTLGFGDVTFQSDLGRMFSVVVVISGTVIMLILLPFTFIQFFYAPWLEARETARAPDRLGPDTRGHVLLTDYGPVDAALIRRLERFRTPYAVIVPDIAEALSLFDRGISVMVGALDDPDTYRRARASHAALVVCTRGDTSNTNIAFTVREVAPHVPIVATAAAEASVDILQLAGAQQVLQLGDLLGWFIARRVFAADRRTHSIGELHGLHVAEADASGTDLVGQTLREARLRERFRLNVAGIWRRGAFDVGGPDTRIADGSVLLLAGGPDDLLAYDRAFGVAQPPSAFVLILGGGRVGRAVAEGLATKGIDYCIVEKLPGRVGSGEKAIVGDAADLAVLKAAGLDRATTVAVTTHDDDMNVYLTLYCRRLRPELQILSRTTSDRNVSTLYRAGANLVLSYASMGASAMINMLRHREMLLLGEGLDVFKAPVPTDLEGRTLGAANIPSTTGCNVLAVINGDQLPRIPDANTVLARGAQLILIGNLEAEGAFFKRFQL